MRRYVVVLGMFVMTAGIVGHHGGGQSVWLVSPAWADNGDAETIKRYEYGFAPKSEGEIEEATSYLKKAIEVAPNNVDAHWVLAWVYLAQDEIYDAIAEFNEVIRIGGSGDAASKVAAAWRWVQKADANVPVEPLRNPDDVLEDLTLVDVSDIVAKEHHWVPQGYSVQWRPDGKGLVFCREHHGFYTMDALCQHIRHVGKGMYFEGMSPDGQTLYGSSPPDGGLFAVAFDGSEARQISQLNCGRCNWSPDGQQVVVSLGFYYNEESEVWMAKHAEYALMSADGSGFRPLAKGECIWPKWSHDGSKLVYAVGGSAYVLNVADFGRTLVAHNAATAGWVGDTGKLWVRRNDGQLVMMSPSGAGAVPVAKAEYDVTFSPSGKWVTYYVEAENENEPPAPEENEDEGVAEPEGVEVQRQILRIADGTKATLNADVCEWFPGEERAIFQRWQPWSHHIGLPLEPDGWKRLANEEGLWDSVTLSPSARIMAYLTRYGSRLGLADAGGMNGRIIAGPAGYGLCWSPHGNAIAYGDNDRTGVVILGRRRE